MSHSLTDFLSMAGAVALLGVVAALFHHLFNRLSTAWVSMRKDEKILGSARDSFGKTTLWYLLSIVALIVFPLVFGIVEYAMYVGGFLVMILGIPLVILLVIYTSLREAFKKNSK